MARYAVMEGMSVSNVILAEDLQTAQEVTGKQCIEAPEWVGPGWMLVNNEFYRAYAFGENDNLKMLEDLSGNFSDLGIPKVDGFLSKDELATKLEEEKLAREQKL
jgi:hypothetical protein